MTGTAIAGRSVDGSSGDRMLIRPPGWPDAVTGELWLKLGQRDERSVAVRQYHGGGLRVVRPHYLDGSGQPCYTVVNPGGGYLGGDHYLLDVEVDTGASLLLTSQSATKVYRTPMSPARQHTWIRLAPGALLELMPDQLIVYREGEYEQTTHAVVDPEATFIAAEVVTPGWAPDGSRFGYRRVVLRTEVRRPGSDEPVLVDALVLEPSAGDMTATGVLDGASHLGSLVVVDRRVDDRLVDEIQSRCDAFVSLVTGVSLAPGPSLVLRTLGDETAQVNDLLLTVDAMLRERWFGTGRVDLRKS